MFGCRPIPTTADAATAIHIHCILISIPKSATTGSLLRQLSDYKILKMDSATFLACRNFDGEARLLLTDTTVETSNYGNRG